MTTWNVLLDLTLKSTVVLAFAWCVTFTLRRRSAAARHIVWTAAFAALLDPRALGIEEPVLLLETEHAMPMTAGILRPAVFIPAEASGWSPDRLRVVLQHECAHILRGDAATQLLARAALCLQWFNPLA